MHIATALQERMADEGLIIGTLISQYALYSALLCSLHSSISKEQRESIPAIYPAITENTENTLVKRAP